jgi:predicted secreted protein
MKILIALLCLADLAMASQHHMVDTLGSSPKGQFVALEEYGYRGETHTYYVSIRIMNVWKKEYVGQPVRVETPAHRPHYLQKARAEAKSMAGSQLAQFQISG